MDQYPVRERVRLKGDHRDRTRLGRIEGIGADIGADVVKDVAGAESIDPGQRIRLAVEPVPGPIDGRAVGDQQCQVDAVDGDGGLRRQPVVDPGPDGQFPPSA